MARPSSIKTFEAALARKAAMQAARCAGTKVPSAKGIGPNKACGTKVAFAGRARNADSMAMAARRF